MLAFLQNLRRLKALPRSGWLSHGVSMRDVESVADHTFSVCALSLLLADLETKRGVKVDVSRVLRMAILHDLSESLTFDIDKAYLQYLGRKGQEIKSELEHAAWSQLVSGLKNPTLAREYTRFQSEYEGGDSFESKIVHAADSLDIMLQVVDYRQRGYSDFSLAEFWKGTIKELKRSDIASAKKILTLVEAHERKLR